MGMARLSALAFVMLLVSGVVAEKSCDNSGSDEESCLLQSAPQQQRHTAEVKAHEQSGCAHLEAAIQREASKGKVDCMGGRPDGKDYCKPGEKVKCPGSN